MVATKELTEMDLRRKHLKMARPVLASAVLILKLEQYREDEHGPSARLTCKLVKRSVFLGEGYEQTLLKIRHLCSQQTYEQKLLITGH